MKIVTEKEVLFLVLLYIVLLLSNLMFGISNKKLKFICAFSFLAGTHTSQAEGLVLRFIHSSHFHPKSRVMFSRERSLVLFSC